MWAGGGEDNFVWIAIARAFAESYRLPGESIY